MRRAAVMGLFERYLSVWVALGIALGCLAGTLFPALFATLARWELANVNLPVALLIWVMIFPMMVKVDFTAARHARTRSRGLLLTVAVNWLIKPFTMALIAVLFFRVLFAGWVPAADATQYIAGMILLGVAPCTAMVFVWSELTEGDATYTLTQVAVNDLIMIVAFAPLAALLLGVTDIALPWQTLLFSVLLYVLAPLAAGVLVRRRLQRRGGEAAVRGATERLAPWTAAGLVATVVLLFGFQGERLLAQPLVMLLIAIPLIVQTLLIFTLTYWLARRLRLPHDIGAPASLIGTSNFFELAVAVAISLFGLQSGAALATVVGVLVEVPVMLALVALINRSRRWYERAVPAPGAKPSGA